MESNNNSTLLGYALQYKDKNFSIIPLQNKSKIPAVDSWIPYRTYIASVGEISDWFSTSDYNVGIVMGSVSKVFAIDIDDKEAYDYFTNRVEQILDDNDLKISIKNTMKIMTGSGNVNFLFRFDPDEFPEGDEIPNTILWKSRDQKEHCEIRLMGEGKYIVAPPSIHPNNQKYCLVNGINPIFLARKQIKKIIDLFSQNKDAKAAQNIEGIEGNKDNYNCIQKITEILKPYYSNGQRNDFVLSLSGWLRKLGLSFEAAEQIILDLSYDDEEQSNRLITLNETYKKNDIDEIVGYSGLIKLLSFCCTESDAKTKLDEVEQIIRENFETSLNKKENKKTTKQQKLETDLVILVRQKCQELFVDQLNKPYAAIKIKDHVENLQIDSYRFKNWLFALIYKETGNLSSSDMVENIIRVLKSEAEFSENTKTLELRVAKTDDYTFYYDLTDRDWSVVKITAEGWIIEKKSLIMFKRYSNQTPQTVPFVSNTISQPNQSQQLENNLLPPIDNTDDIFSTFLDLLNIKDDDTKLLLKCYIISLFVPGMPKPILMLHGEQGSAKSTCQELIKMLVDPSSLKTLSFPRGIDELVQKLSHNYIAFFDNISKIPDWISDLFCRVVMGSSFSKRELYTNDDDILYSFQRIIGFNGINLGATKADLLDRGIIIPLQRISKEDRRKLQDIWKEFERIKPLLLSYIFDILVKVLALKKQCDENNTTTITIPGGYNRMADFEEYGELISRCMGYPENEFLRIYQNNIGIQIDESIESSPLSQSIIILMDDREKWEGSASHLYEKLCKIAEQELKIKINSAKFWPKSPNALSRRLNEVITNLREKGIIIEKDRDSKSGNRIIKICKISSESSYRRNSENQAQNEAKNTDDIIDDINSENDNIVKISSDKNNENQARNDVVPTIDDIDDTLHVLDGRFEVNNTDTDNQFNSNNANPNDGYNSDNDKTDKMETKIRRKYPHSDIWICDDCTDFGDIHYMKVHQCRHNKKRNDRK